MSSGSFGEHLVYPVIRQARDYSGTLHMGTLAQPFLPDGDTPWSRSHSQPPRPQNFSFHMFAIVVV